MQVSISWMSEEGTKSLVPVPSSCSPNGPSQYTFLEFVNNKNMHLEVLHGPSLEQIIILHNIEANNEQQRI